MRRQRKRRREPHSPDAQVHSWPAWRGSARATDQERPREVFTSGDFVAQGAPVGDASTCATHQTPGRDPVRCQARRRQEQAKPERDPALDLLGEEESSKSVWWGRKRTQRRSFCPRWRQRRTPEVAGIAGRR
jgi:hypothetical protein